MSKQIYIDSNGNEIQVSGTVNTADMMPMSASDSRKVSEAIEEVDDDLVFKQVSINAPIPNLASGGSVALSANDFNYTIPDGYTPICLYGYTMFGNANGCLIYELGLISQGTNTVCRIYNSASTPTSSNGRVYLGILLVKTSRVQ